MALPNYDLMSVEPRPSYSDSSYDETEMLFDNGTKKQTRIFLYNEEPGTRTIISGVSEITVSPEDAVKKLNKKNYVVKPGVTAEFNLVTVGHHNRVSFIIAAK
jgi:hypothetical protein